MALEILHREIFNKTAALKFPRNEALARTFYLVLSPSMSHLREWFQKWFPASDDNIKKVQPWIIFDPLNGGDTLDEIISGACIDAFDIDVVNNLTTKGYRVLDTANHVILIGDLTEEGFIEHIGKVYDSFTRVADRFITHRVPLHFTGLFLVRNIDRGNDGKVTVKNIRNFAAVIQWMQQALNKVFLVDVSNPCGAVVSKSTDLHFFLGQLLYILTKKPIEFSKAQDSAGFVEWVNRDCPSDGKCGGFSGISILSPIDQILETLLISKGGEVLEEAFFGGFQEEKAKPYLMSLLNRTHLNSEEVFRKMLLENKTYPLIKPLGNLDGEKAKWDINRTEDFSVYIDSLDARLPADAAENRRIMENLSQKLLDDFRYSLLEHLNAVIINERGGLLIAERFLDELRKRISGMIPEKVTAPSYPDITNLIRTLENRCKKGPRLESVSVRTLVLVMAAAAGTLSSQGSFDLPAILFPFLACASAGGGVLYWYGSKNRIEGLVSDIWNNLFQKWNKLMEKETGEIYRSVLPQYIPIVDELASRVRDASKRLKEITTYFRNEFTAKVPDSSAFWIYALSSREHIMKYITSLKTDVVTTATDYLRDERPLELWNRTAVPGTHEPNEWEWSLGEGIGLRLLPLSQDIVDLSICRILRDSPEQVRNFSEVLRRSAEPFLNVKPGTQHCSVKASFEVPGEGCDDLHKQLEDSIKSDFGHIERRDSLTPYRISLFCFVENVDIDSLKLEG
jgi:hypothetical protein